MMGLDYRHAYGGRAKVPKGKLPYIDDDEVIVTDSTFIRFHLEEKFAVDLDEGWDSKSRAKAGRLSGWSRINSVCGASSRACWLSVAFCQA